MSSSACTVNCPQPVVLARTQPLSLATCKVAAATSCTASAHTQTARSHTQQASTAGLARLRTVVAAERGAGPWDGVAAADHAAVCGLGRHKGVAAGRVLVLQPGSSGGSVMSTDENKGGCLVTPLQKHCSAHNQGQWFAHTRSEQTERSPAGNQRWMLDSSRCGRHRSAARWRSSQMSWGSPSASEPANVHIGM